MDIMAQGVLSFKYEAEKKLMLELLFLKYLWLVENDLIKN
jgi:hypothetical protein